MSSKTVLIIEDDPTNRLSLLSALRMRNFRAEAAANVSEARDWADKLDGQIDVMVLDMRLEDPHYDLTGADLGLEVRRAQTKRPPEFLIFSGYKQVDYYHAALRLGAAAYLEKGTVGQDDLIRHIRSLALCRALSIERAEIATRIEQIEQRSRTPASIVASLCHQLLTPEIEACLSLPFIFLLSDKQGTKNCGGDSGLLVGYDPAYATVQALVHGLTNSSDPFVFDPQHLRDPSDRQASNIYQKLDGAAFLPLSHNHDFQLSLGILKHAENTRLPDEPEKVARSIGQYASSRIGELILVTLTRCQELKSIRRLAVLSGTARLCLYVGQEQLAVLSEAEETEKLSPHNESFQRLKALALDLRATGEQFSLLHGAAKAAAQHLVDAPPVDIVEVVQQAWEEIREQFPTEDITLEERGIPFSLAIDRNDLLLATLRVLQWMAQRTDKVPASTRPKIVIEYSAGADAVEISFSDSSRRLSSRLRHQLFDPFTQVTTAPPLVAGAKRPGLYLPLYLAAVLVEIKHHGILEDRTDLLDGIHGHCFVMSFPADMEGSVVAARAGGTGG